MKEQKVSSCHSVAFVHDASLLAYAAVIYLKVESEDESCMRFIAAKMRVAPLKKQSVPRLELLST